MFQMIFFRAPKSLTAINRCLEEMEELGGYPKKLIDGTLSKVNKTMAMGIKKTNKKY